MNRDGLTATLRNLLWAECANIAKQLDDICVREKGKSHFEHYHGYNSKYEVDLRRFGEMAVVKTAPTIQSKLKNKGTVAIFVGYCENHASGTYRFYNLVTREMMVSRDAVWLQVFYG